MDKVCEQVCPSKSNIFKKKKKRGRATKYRTRKENLRKFKGDLYVHPEL